ncbi:MAG: putative nuclease of restriction endonuclease-like RecB superfamily, partial [Myxococcota bacterium]
MLTSDLVRVRLPRGGIIAPTFIKPNSKDLLETAEILVGLLNDALAEGWTKGQVDQAITEAIGDRRDQKLIRGVAKIILDRCTFEVATPLPPAELREAVFLAAHAAGGVSLTAGPLGHATCDTVMLDVAQSMNMDPNDLAAALYGDLPDEQRLTAFDAR